MAQAARQERGRDSKATACRPRATSSTYQIAVPGISMPLADIYRRQVALLSASCLSSRKEKSFALKGDIAIRPRSRPPCCAAASTMWSFAASPRPWKTPLVLPRNEDRVETTRSMPRAAQRTSPPASSTIWRIALVLHRHALGSMSFLSGVVDERSDGKTATERTLENLIEKPDTRT